MFWFDFSWQIQSFLNQFFWQINLMLLVVLVFLGYFSYKKPIYAVGLTIILLPTYLFRSNIWFIPFTFLELCIWVTFLGWFISQIINHQRTQGSRFQVPGSRFQVLLILLAATVSLLFSPDLRAAAGIWKAYFIEPILFFLVLVNVAKTEEDKKIILWSLGISTLAISFLAIYQKFSGFGIAEPIWADPAKRRVTSIFTSPNAVGLYLGPIMAIYFGWLASELPKARFANRAFWLVILKLLIIIPALLAILFTVSQGTWLGLLAAIIFLAFFSWNKKLTAAIVLILIILTLALPMTREKIWPIVTFQDASGQNRLTLIQMSEKYLLTNAKNFIFGAGISGFAEIQNQLREPLKMEALLYPHNIFLNFWLEIGLLGLISFIWLIIKFFKQGFEKFQVPSSKFQVLGIAAAMIVIVVHGLIDVPYFKNDLAVLFWIIIGLI